MHVRQDEAAKGGHEERRYGDEAATEMVRESAEDKECRHGGDEVGDRRERQIRFRYAARAVVDLIQRDRACRGDKDRRVRKRRCDEADPQRKAQRES